jgi:hypothetical protein
LLITGNDNESGIKTLSWLVATTFEDVMPKAEGVKDAFV